MKACITGASSGIGKEFARQLSKQGFSLILIARNKERLQAVVDQCDTPCEMIICDLANQQDCIQLADKLSKEEIDVFINNAGFGKINDFDESDLDVDLEMIDVNVKAMQIFLRKLLPSMEKRGGKILNVSSSAGLMVGGPYMATYYATKAYITSLTSSIYQELKSKNSNVYIGMLCPGPVNTNFNEVANVKFALKGISAQECVKYALKEMDKGTLVIIPTISLKMAAFFSRILPRKLQLKMVMHQQSKKR